jgi:GTP-binding protein HflX
MQPEERAVLVAVMQQDQTEQQVNEYLDELAFLVELRGFNHPEFVQKLAHPDSKTFIGKGKLEEIRVTYGRNSGRDF